jgi:hypothetical protein
MIRRFVVEFHKQYNSDSNTKINRVEHENKVFAAPVWSVRYGAVLL